MAQSHAEAIGSGPRMSRISFGMVLRATAAAARCRNRGWGLGKRPDATDKRADQDAGQHPAQWDAVRRFMRVCAPGC